MIEELFLLLANRYAVLEDKLGFRSYSQRELDNTLNGLSLPIQLRAWYLTKGPEDTGIDKPGNPLILFSPEKIHDFYVTRAFLDTNRVKPDPNWNVNWIPIARSGLDLLVIAHIDQKDIPISGIEHIGQRKWKVTPLFPSFEGFLAFVFDWIDIVIQIGGKYDDLYVEDSDAVVKPEVVEKATKAFLSHSLPEYLDGFLEYFGLIDPLRGY